MQVVGEAANGAEGIELARQLHPDIILMDIQMPILNGIEATKQIVSEMPDIKVIMLTMFQEENQELSALRVGALGYVNKDSNPADLLRAVHLVANGDAFLTPQATRRMLSTFQSRQLHIEAPPDHVILEEREIELLRYLARGLSSKQIAQELSLSDSYVRNLLSALYVKLEVNGRAQAAAHAVEMKLI